MEVLKHDLRAIQGGIKDILDAFGGKLTVPSWKFPSKQAADVDLNELLKTHAASSSSEDVGEVEGHATGHRFYLLELIVDRLLFLLQCCIALSDQTLSKRSTNLPMTVGSTVKKFSKKILQGSATVKDVRKQMSSKDATISSLQSTVSKLQRDCAHLEKLNSNASTHGQVVESSRLGLDEGLELIRPSTGASSCVPYEAMGTLKMSSFTTLPTEFQKRHTSSTSTESTIALTSSPLSDPSHHLRTSHKVSVSTQTTETAFALCIHCSETQDTLIDVADSILSLCREQELQSNLSSTDWKALAEVDGLDVSLWRKHWKTDIYCISEHCSRLRGTIGELERERDTHKMMVGKLESEIEQLSCQMDRLQENVEDIQKRSEQSLSTSRESFTSQLRQLELAKDGLEAKSARLKEELTVARSQEAHLRSLVANLELKHGQLQCELDRVQGREAQLAAAKQSLEEGLRLSKVEVESYRDQLDQNQVELSKTKVYSHTLDKRNKSLQTKQAGLLSRLDELDQDCTGLREKLEEVEENRHKLQREMKDIQSQCNGLQKQLQEEQERLAQSYREQENLIQVVSELEEELSEVKVQLDKEMHNCRLLMDYPFIKQVNSDYCSHVASLTGPDMERQISANTVRILLLEEQNTELRDKRISHVQSQPNQSQSYQVRQPTPLWRKAFFSQIQEEKSSTQQSSQERLTQPSSTSAGDGWSNVVDCTSVHFDNGYPPRGQSASLTDNAKDTRSLMRDGETEGFKNKKTNGRSNSAKQPHISTAKLKGRLGHLVAAIAQAHHTDSNSSAPSTNTPAAGVNEGGTGVQIRPEVLHPCNNAWVSTSKSSLQGVDSISEMYMCSKCDRMYTERSRLEQHESVCQCDS